jgi:dTDP-4-amino-4,6-dideoxygalactose transaminase
MRPSFLPPFRHTIGEEEISEVVDTLRSDWITTGPKTSRFEESFREFIGCKHAVAVSSCTAALELSLASVGVGKGDEVITSPFTFAATAEVIIHQNATPRFADVEKETYNLSPEEVVDNVSANTKAIIPVHYGGQPCEMDELAKIAAEYDLAIIEDAAHAFGASYKNRMIGTVGDSTCFSFYATKNITTADGGMVTTNSDTIAAKVRILSLHGISKDAWKRYSDEGTWHYEILLPGYKYNMTDIQAAIGIHQLRKAPEMQKRREEIATKYTKAFENIPEITTPCTKKNVKHAWHLYPLLINANLLSISRNGFIEALKSENIGTSVHFIPLHLHPYYKDTYGYKRGDFPIAESVFDREISLPIYPRMTEDDVDDVIASVHKVVDEHGA